MAEGVAGDIAEVGGRLHVTALDMAADAAVPLDPEESFAAFVDLGLRDEDAAPTAWSTRTEAALEAVCQRLGAALLASAWSDVL